MTHDEYERQRVCLSLKTSTDVLFHVPLHARTLRGAALSNRGTPLSSLVRASRMQGFQGPYGGFQLVLTLYRIYIFCFQLSNRLLELMKRGYTGIFPPYDSLEKSREEIFRSRYFHVAFNASATSASVGSTPGAFAVDLCGRSETISEAILSDTALRNVWKYLVHLTVVRVGAGRRSPFLSRIYCFLVSSIFMGLRCWKRWALLSLLCIAFEKSDRYGS